jgi:hypothetical protein
VERWDWHQGTAALEVAHFGRGWRNIERLA